MSRRAIAAGIGAAALVLVTSEAFGQTAGVHVPTVDEAITLDGVLDEPAWVDAAVLDGFSVYYPDTGLAKRADAVAYVVRDADALYLAVEVRAAVGGARAEAGRAEVHAPVSRRDDVRGDYVELQLDPWNNGVRGYLFRVNAAGVLADALITASGYYDYAWDSLFDAGATRTEAGWSVELRVPFQSLRFDPATDAWGAHVFVETWAANQSLSWAPIDRANQDFFAQSGTLRGVGGGRPGRAIEVLPHVTLGSVRRGGDAPRPACELEGDVRSSGECATELDYGVGLKWGVTPWLTLDGVFNPDFSQVEADPAQLRLNERFALGLIERRPFFLEGADIFEAPLGTVYTRSINRPYAASKLTGQLRRGRFGTLVALDRDTPGSVLDDALTSPHTGAGAEALTTITRAVWDVTDDDALGLTLTSKLWTGEDSAYDLVAALDTSARVVADLWLDAAVAVSTAETFEDERLDGAAGRVFAQWRADSYRFQATWESFSDAFRAETGFVPRVDFHHARLKWDYYHRSESDLARFVSPGVWGDGFWNGEGELVDSIAGANTYWEFGHRVWSFVEYQRIGERYDDAEGSRWFGMDSVYASAGTSTLRWLEATMRMTVRDSIVRDASLRAEGERAFVGAELTPNGDVTLRPTGSLAWTNAYRTRLLYRRLGGERLGAQPILRSSLTYYPRRELELRGIFEWDVREELVSNDLLFGWTPRPGNVLYLGFREQTRVGPTTALAERAFFLKFSRLLVF